MTHPWVSYTRDLGESIVHNQSVLSIFRDLIRRIFHFTSPLWFPLSRPTEADSFKSLCRNTVWKTYRDLVDSLSSTGKQGDAISKIASVNLSRHLYRHIYFITWEVTVQCPIFLYPVTQSIGRQLCFVLRTSLAGELTQNIAKQKRVTRMGKVLNSRYSNQLKELVMISLRKIRLGRGVGKGSNTRIIPKYYFGLDEYDVRRRFTKGISLNFIPIGRRQDRPRISAKIG